MKKKNRTSKKSNINGIRIMEKSLSWIEESAKLNNHTLEIKLWANATRNIPIGVIPLWYIELLSSGIPVKCSILLLTT